MTEMTWLSMATAQPKPRQNREGGQFLPSGQKRESQGTHKVDG